MERSSEEHEVLPNYDHHQLSFSSTTPNSIHDMGFVLFQDLHQHHQENNNNVMSFLTPSNSSQLSHPLEIGTSTTTTTTTVANTENTGCIRVVGQSEIRQPWSNEMVCICTSFFLFSFLKIYN